MAVNGLMGAGSTRTVGRWGGEEGNDTETADGLVGISGRGGEDERSTGSVGEDGGKGRGSIGIAADWRGRDSNDGIIGGIPGELFGLGMACILGDERYVSPSDMTDSGPCIGWVGVEGESSMGAGEALKGSP